MAIEINNASYVVSLFAAKGGQGTTVAAASMAVASAKSGRRVLLVDAANHRDMAACLGMAEGPGVRTVIDNLDTISADGEPIDATGYLVIVDAGQDPAAVSADRALLVTRPCYLALRAALALTERPDGVILITEAGRSLNADDVVAILGAPVVASVRQDSAIARAVDAGLLASRLPGTLESLGHLVGSSDLYQSVSR